MSKILIVAEHDGARLNPSTGKCVTCAAQVPEVYTKVVALALHAAPAIAQAATAATSG